MTDSDEAVERLTHKALLQIQQLCESAMKWDEGTTTLTDRAWLAKCILDILKEKVGS